MGWRAEVAVLPRQSSLIGKLRKFVSRVVTVVEHVASRIDDSRNSSLRIANELDRRATGTKDSIRSEFNTIAIAIVHIGKASELTILIDGFLLGRQTIRGRIEGLAKGASIKCSVDLSKRDGTHIELVIDSWICNKAWSPRPTAKETE